MTSKNLIVIIGNGFDLAHGLKTSYSDFADYFLVKKIKNELQLALNQKTNYNNEIFNFKFLKTFVEKKNIQTDYNFIDNLWLKIKKEDKSISEFLRKNHKELSSVLNNQFLVKLYANSYEHWFDIENAYFSELIQIKKQISNESVSKIKRKIKQLNLELEHVKNELQIYLTTEISIFKMKEIQSFITTNLNFRNREEIYFVNFNYTSTIEQYLGIYSKRKNIKVNYIHGKLSEKNIIFGYGNDQNSEYQEIKNTGIDEFLEHFKTFEYLKDNNYSDIYINSIDKYYDYEVIVLGHSLGLTDKTLLEEIFNSEKCKKIHFYKRRDLEKKEKDLKKYFNNLIYSASRIVDSERNLRRKVNNFRCSKFFP